MEIVNCPNCKKEVEVDVLADKIHCPECQIELESDFDEFYDSWTDDIYFVWRLELVDNL